MAAVVEVAVCGVCGAEVPADAAECPKCGEVFEPQVAELEGLKGLAPKAEAEAEAGGKSRILFYAGLAMVLLGGPGIALGSWLHDVFEIPIGGSAYEIFGPFNRLVSALGLVVLVAGIVLLILALRLYRPAGEDYDLGGRPEDEAAR